MSTATTKVEQFKGVLNQQSIRAQLKNSLRDNAGAFMSSMIDLYSGDTSLQNCDPEAVALECIKAAALKLPIVKSLGFAYVVPYRGKPTFTIGYKGLIQLAQRTGYYKTINAGVVYEGEMAGIDKLSGGIDLSGERVSNTVIGYFAYFRLINGFEKMLYMNKAEMEAHGKRYSPSYNSAASPWRTEFDKMAQKTILRRLIGTYGVMTTEMQAALVSDDQTVSAEPLRPEANSTPIDVEAQEVLPAPKEQPGF